MALKRYLFTITLSGIGESPEEAWEEAVEAFSLDPGNYDDFKIDNDFDMGNMDKTCQVIGGKK